MTYKPQIGDLAYCQHGKLGLILSSKVYHDGDGIIRTIWKGVHIDSVDKPWQSEKPTFYATLKEIVFKD